MTELDEVNIGLDPTEAMIDQAREVVAKAVASTGGKTDAEVLALCGEPASRISTAVPVRAGVKSGFTRFVGYSTSEQWVFDRGWGRFPAVLYFDHGKIQRIDFLPYRSGDL